MLSLLGTLMASEEAAQDTTLAPSLGNYNVGAIIGRGEFATVKLGEHVSTGKKFAMKWLDKSRLDQKVQREITISEACATRMSLR
jgi:serine/threonine-protein kinase NIM1